MITNDRQYRVTKTQIQRLRSALQSHAPLKLLEGGVDPVIVEAQRRGLEQQLGELERDVLKYESLKAAGPQPLVARSLADVGNLLIEARVAQGLTQRALAERLGMYEQQVQRYEQERYQTANLARISQIAEALNLTLSIEASAKQEALLKRDDGFDAKKLPVREMKKRGWLSNVQVEGVADAQDHELAANFILQSTGGQAFASLHKQNLKLGAKANAYALLAWKARVLEKARIIRQKLGSPRSLDPIFVKRLVALSKDADGIVDAVKLLRSIGVIVVFEEHFASTYLDGAALLLDNQVPVVAMTLRHDRLDNFWFVLLHEIGHIARHRDNGLQDGFFDDDSVRSVAQFEAEADEFARGALIPEAIWKSSFVKFTKSREQVVEFASRLGVGVPVVAGRIRSERGDYSLFSDLVGSGEVRKRISGANLMD